MKICKLLKKDAVSFSCEVFPPKENKPVDSIYASARQIAALHPDFMSVTYGAGGSTSRHTAQLAISLQRDIGVATMAHLTCVSSTKEQIAAQLATLQAGGIENILALRGDRPVSGDVSTDYRYAVELIADIRAMGDFCIGAACYPEGHVECRHKENDIDFLKAKVDAGCDFLITQMFFDNAVLYSFLYQAMKKGIHVPVIAGIMPVTGVGQIKRSCELSGATLPPKFKAILDRFGDHPEAMKKAGIAYATEQIVDLIANGVRGIHLYTMNKPDVAQAILANIAPLLACGGAPQ